MKILYGTGNRAKLDSMRRRLSGLPVDIVGLKDLKLEIPNVPEDGDTPLENARQKAQYYYKASGMPVFSCDSGLYIDELPDELQPAVHVRTVNGIYLTDDEMVQYYSNLAKTYGDFTARYKNAICLILDDNHIYESMDESLASEPFIITAKPHHILKKGFPLDSLSIDIKTGKYYYDIDKGELDQLAVEHGFLDFFKKHLEIK